MRRLLGNVEDFSNRAVIMVEGQEVAIFQVAGQFFAIENHCPHDGVSFSERGKVLTNCRILCGAHSFVYDLRTGENIRKPVGERATRAARVYRVNEQNGKLFLEEG